MRALILNDDIEIIKLLLIIGLLYISFFIVKLLILNHYSQKGDTKRLNIIAAAIIIIFSIL